MAAVTLLSLGNGAPDVFSSLAALRSGQPRTGLGAILSAGAFVSALVVGFVAIYAAPFSVDPAPFIRDVLFYLTSALFLFYVYLSAEIFLWQAIGFVGFYVFFVGFVFYMDLGIGDRRVKIGNESVSDLEQQKELITSHQEQVKRRSSRFRRAFELISKLWEVPVSTLLKLTIPQPAPSQWSRFYASANIALCPLALLYACNSIMPFNHPIVFLLPNTHFPLWSVVLTTSFSLAFLHFIIEKEPPKTEQLPVVVTAFVMSVFWISTTAGELVNCLEAIGILLKLPPAILGLTVLAWGNSVGDLVADVAVAKAGHPAMAMAGCFAGPMFNMLVGLGSALVIQTANIYPRAYELNFHCVGVYLFDFTWNRMDHQGHGQNPNMGVPYGSNPYQQSQMTGAPGSVVTSAGNMQSTGQPTGAQLGQHQLAYQHIHQQQQQQLQQQLQQFWANQYQEIEQVTDFKNHSLPLARIKKIMKADEDVRMISAEAPVIFARACEMFILELTLRSWNHTEENKRRTLQKNDIAAAITRTDIFDFLVDIVPREDLKDEVLASIPRGAMPVAGPADALPYMYMQPQHAPQAGAPGVIMGKPVMDPSMYAQQPHPYMAPQMWPRPQDQQPSSPDH
ncbi:hypothetical protein TanjilG_29302 [Lupinus angustifolius]|uniref:Histone H2A/H2B/H3 domain-containing protein n=2 Tax=Lupinus angustifolius TaxID=3871 RepID=A0A1J7IF80_LUPAN|nr:hypothetical protein TanjilG_29302 [Lupinus angustifolius]